MKSMTATRISATLPADLLSFLEGYQLEHGLESRSAALARAVQALRDESHLKAYEELGKAQLEGVEHYPADNTDGLDVQDSAKWH